MLPNYLSHANHIRCVPVIAVFSSKGEIKPLYVTINGIQLKIESYSVQENTITDCSAHLQEVAGPQNEQHHLKPSHGVRCGSFCLL